MKFYNLKLRKSVEVESKDITKVTLKNGRPAAKATVSIDGVEFHRVGVRKKGFLVH